MVRLGDVAPAIPVKNVNFDEDELVWQLNLDQVEPNTGKIIDKVKQPLSSAGSSTHFFNNEHVLYSKLRPYLNKVVVPDELGIATTELVPMKPDQKRLNKEYLAYYLRSKPFAEWVSTQVSGAKMPRVVMSIFWQHEMPLPPLYEQERIVAILDKSDGICQKREQAIKLADDFLRATFLEMFGDPVKNPKGWKKDKIKKGVLDITSGWSATGENIPCKSDEFGVLKISSVTSGIFKPEENKVVDCETIPVSKKLILPKKGDLLFSRANTRELVAAICMVHQDYDNLFLPDKLWSIKLNHELLLPEFFLILIQNEKVRELLTKQATGTSGSMLNISKSKFEETEIIFPEINVQKDFRNTFIKTSFLKEKLIKSNELAKESFNSLSQKVFQQ
ncbi:restriction endonuclease subunit S [Cronobacter sakazakii]|nr:restriction endonuclease subunit S [Cronobacter sakazakii]HCA5736768.1 restriction endonuclease subunit S [Citrobacter freundii]EKK5173486.1 restriction endonuclease subunit S [Cronobacter sakazakii]EKY2045978.1 restriction endonuclease subunit S [Cronobacter sakazakii]MCI0202440.1 restriction endonuclease subunit S [Cronobacter sakazakii]MCI0294927.1 restriction endonuclease subunit S [Cronobacter sakazakii]